MFNGKGRKRRGGAWTRTRIERTRSWWMIRSRLLSLTLHWNLCCGMPAMTEAVGPAELLGSLARAGRLRGRRRGERGALPVGASCTHPLKRSWWMISNIVAQDYESCSAWDSSGHQAREGVVLSTFEATVLKQSSMMMVNLASLHKPVPAFCQVWGFFLVTWAMCWKIYRFSIFHSDILERVRLEMVIFIASLWCLLYICVVTLRWVENSCLAGFVFICFKVKQVVIRYPLLLCPVEQQTWNHISWNPCIID